ncbi:MAG: hypothetical protein JNJ90_10095 [Saprospiraceae bacterium]|jgi:hypothetical protein|nr:hypothetical protein [Saprospiraceae bacterium]
MLRFTRFHLPALLSLLLVSQSTLFGFQLADGARPAPNTSDKYIFYWGNLQADLTRANNFHATAELTVQDFRQMLLHQPKLWNGKVLVAQVAFRLNGHPLTATRTEQDYVTRLGWLDETFGRPATEGQVLRLTDLRLDEATTGSVDIRLKEPEQQPSKDVVVWQSNTTSMLNTQLLEQVAWGREDILEISNRDFFTENEFRQIIRLEPFVVWNPYVPQREVRAGIRIASRALTEQGFSCVLESTAYRSMVDNVENYKHLVRPGSLVTLTLFTDQHDRLYEKALNIVADNDPRLTLRRNRDAHRLRVKWGAMDQTIPNLYLQNDLRDASGAFIGVDDPKTMRYTLNLGERIPMLSLRPEVWIDGESVPDLAFSLSSGDGWLVQVPAYAPMPDSLGASIPEKSTLQLDNLQAVGYDLSALTFVLTFTFPPNDLLLVRNRLSSLLVAGSSARIALHPPELNEKAYAVSFELKEPAMVRLSLFEPDGWNTWTLEEKYAAGQHRVEIPRSVFRNPGKHYLFLSTPFGVARQEFEAR